MENLNREAILRMLSGKTGNSSSGGGGGDIDLAGYATMIWVTENFVSIDFFRELFRAYDSNSQEILPNNTTSVVNNIKAMVGLWTEQYLTALGNQSGGGGGGGGASYLNDLLDVELTTPLTDGQALVYNATLQKWVNGAAGVNMTTVWNALAGSTNEQINASHLSTALSGYVTTSAISDMATQTWVGQQGFATQTWVTSNFITIAYFDRLFRAYNGSTLVSHNDTTTTIDNIKAMLGFWTEFYLSALGTGGISTVGIGLSQLNDVTLTSPTSGQALVYDAINNKWVNGTIQTGVSTLSSLTDVLLTSPTANQVLIWDATSSKWVNTSLKTINYQSIIGSGDISVGGGASGNYLPLSGGTLTNPNWRSQLTINRESNRDSVIAFSNTNGLLGCLGFDGITSKPCVWYGDSGSGIEIATVTQLGNYLPLSGGTMTGSILNNTKDSNAIGSESVNFATVYSNHFHPGSGNNLWLDTDHFVVCNSTGVLLSSNNGNHLYLGGANRNSSNSNNTQIVFGTSSDQHVALSSNTNMFMVKPSTSSNQNYSCIGCNGVDSVISDQLLIDEGVHIGHTNEINGAGSNNTSIHINYRESGIVSLCVGGGNCGVGTGDPVYKLHVVGSIYASGGVTALSDIRRKKIISDADIKVDDIARMPAILYRWNDGRNDERLHVGSIAQNWQTVLPEVVLRANDKEGTLSMQYGVAALVSSIITARKVVNHEERIRQLEKENKELKERLKIA